MADFFYPVCRKGERELERPARRRKAGEWRPERMVFAILASGETGGGFARPVCLGPPSQRSLRSVLGPLVATAAEVHSTRHAWYTWFCRCARLPHRCPRVGEEDALLPRVWPARARLRLWLAGFRGVAAKYLDRYLAWFATREGWTDGPAILRIAYQQFPRTQHHIFSFAAGT
ncbi:MAG: hypothetical protein ACM3RP_02960 [Chitinophagales bacterium]